MGAAFLERKAPPVPQVWRCANCAIEFAWRPVRRHGHEYCCVGCAAGGPCTCDYGALPPLKTSPHSVEAGKVPTKRSGDTKAGGDATVAKIRPVGDRVVVKPSAKEEISKGGIIIPDTAKEKPQEGTVIAVGGGKLLDNGERSSMELKVGDKVLFAKYGGTEFKFEGEDLLVLRESDVLAILSE